MSDDVILSFVKGSGKTYTLSADDMVYLNSQGVSQAVLSVLMQPQGAAPGIPPVSAPPASADRLTHRPGCSACLSSPGSGSSLLQRRPPMRRRLDWWIISPPTPV